MALTIKLSSNRNHIIFIKDKELDGTTGLLGDRTIGIREIDSSIADADRDALVTTIEGMKITFDGRPDQNGFTRVKIA